MGQTLTHGVYLPDEGERNCYSGLAGNWSILDGAVGTIAEHTAALAGKAPLVHTHTKSDITDFPAYGTTAGTICEGNDARLSDARTPVAHTHTKSDVTDLLNSDFIPSANNSYNLGSSSYQWNNLYAKNYYYNGTAWGLDKANTWSNINTSQREICISGDRDSYIAPMWEGASSGIAFLNSDATKTFVFGQYTTDANNRKAIDGTKGRLLIRTGERNGETVLDFEPRAANAILGTSTNKWKTLNSINPGALSLPDYNNYLDVTSNIPVASLDGTQIDLNTYLADKTGWLSIVIADTAGNYITVTQGRAGGSTVFNNSRTFHTGAQSNGYISVFFPIIASMSKFAFIKASSLIQMRFYYSLGNV